jgi:hypothetical protein
MTGHNLNLILKSNFKVVEWDNYHEFNIIQPFFKDLELKFIIDLVNKNNFVIIIFNQQNETIINIKIA